MTRNFTDTELRSMQEWMDAHGGKIDGWRPPSKKRRKNEESIMQKAVVAWFRANANRLGVDAKLLVAVPNGAVFGTGISAVIRARNLMAEGLSPGYPDLQLDVARDFYHGLKIEMKLPGKNPEPHQEVWHEILKAQGYRVEVCRSLEEAKKVITEYLT